MLSQCVEDPNLDLAGISVLLYGSDNLDGDHLSRFDVVALHHLAKRSLTQLADNLICKIEEVSIEHQEAEERSVATHIDQ